MQIRGAFKKFWASI